MIHEARTPRTIGRFSAVGVSAPALLGLAPWCARGTEPSQAAVESERRPPFIWARVQPPSHRSTGSIERTGWLTPYTVETIVDSALRAGPGARLEMAVPPNVGNRVLMRIRAELAWLDRRHIA